MKAALLLIISNVFMTFAWYGHLKWFPERDAQQHLFPFKIILISWAIAFFEYCFQVPGNRIGKQLENLNYGQLKIMQEVITLGVFTVFSLLFLKQPLSWRYGAACLLMIGAVAIVFAGRTE
jgi:uncharacterized protein (DUF486 family)